MASDTAFNILTKPVGPVCNMDCTYCFYLEKEKLYQETRRTKNFRMPDSVLETYISQYIESQDTPYVDFAWQGGEPTLMGVDFFERVVELQSKYSGGKTIGNAIQTNGVNLDDEWCSFFAENHFLVGISIDGPEKIHDAYRVFKSGEPTFEKVMKAIELLKKHKVEFNTLTCVHHQNEDQGRVIYRFLKRIGSRYMQFIPIIERKSTDDTDILSLVQPGYGKEAKVTEWSVDSEQYGQFLIDVFDEWIKKDVGKIFVQMFDVALANWYGTASSLCVFSETCGRSLAIEHNGDLYSCDHFVYPEYKLGNIMNTSLGEMVGSPVQQTFGEDKKARLTKYCRECSYRFACHGGCPKQRFIKTPDGEDGLNYLCQGYKKFFRHVDPYMQFMVNELDAQRPPSNVMKWNKK